MTKVYVLVRTTWEWQDVEVTVLNVYSTRASAEAAADVLRMHIPVSADVDIEERDLIP